MLRPHPDNMKTPSVSLLLGVCLLLPAVTVCADHPLVLKIPKRPVMTGSDVSLYCEKRNGDFLKAFFYVNETLLASILQQRFTIHNVKRSDEGLYSCSTYEYKKSPQSWLRVRDPPTTSDPHIITSSTTSDPHIITLYTAPVNLSLLPNASFPPPPVSSTFPSPTRPLLITIIAVLGSLVFVVLLFMVVVELVQLSRKQTDPEPGLRRRHAGTSSCSLIQLICDDGTFLSGWRSFPVLCCLTLLPVAGVALLLYGLIVASGSLPPHVSGIRHFLRLVVFCPFVISTGLMVSSCCSRKTRGKPVVIMEMSQRVRAGQRLDKVYDDITAGVTSEDGF
ncbi:uncharacterized protein [Channa argus]|uniref:uncharacterized protein n=1 Tax=Channa argus TaxID=215402 RepID=UPI003520FF1A